MKHRASILLPNPESSLYKKDLNIALQDAFRNIYDDLIRILPEVVSVLPTASIEYYQRTVLLSNASDKDSIHVCVYDDDAGDYVWVQVYPIADVSFTDYSSSSTVNGWASFTTKKLWYKKTGSLVYVCFEFAGTSDDTVVNFTLPYPRATSFPFGGVTSVAADNGTWLTTPGRVYFDGDKVNVYSNAFSGAWTASGTKTVVGQFFYGTNT